MYFPGSFEICLELDLHGTSAAWNVSHIFHLASTQEVLLAFSTVTN
jgi:hypothetical protein